MPFKVYYLDHEEALCENFLDYFANKNVEVTTFTDPAKVIAHSQNSEFPFNFNLRESAMKNG